MSGSKKKEKKIEDGYVKKKATYWGRKSEKLRKSFEIDLIHCEKKGKGLWRSKNPGAAPVRTKKVKGRHRGEGT